MSDEHQEQSAASTTELGESNGSLGIGYDPDDASNYAKEVNALLYADQNATTETEEESTEEEVIEEAQEEEAPAEETEEESTTEETEETEEEEQPKAARYRIKAKNDVERTALALHKANPDWTLEQSIDAAKKLHPETATETHEEAESESVSLDTIDAQIAELKEKRKAAIKEFDADLQIEIEDQLDALKDQKSNLALKQQERAITEEQRFYAEADHFAKEAVALYPDSANPNSALAKEMARIDADLIATDNPLIYDPKKAFRVAQMAANNLAIAPRSQTKPVTVKKTSTRPAFQPSSGTTRSTTAAAPVLDALAKDDMTLSEYEALVGQVS
jgi:hypothetical protein